HLHVHPLHDEPYARHRGWAPTAICNSHTDVNLVRRVRMRPRRHTVTRARGHHQMRSVAPCDVGVHGESGGGDDGPIPRYDVSGDADLHETYRRSASHG